MKCPKCKSDMEKGQLIDRGHLNILLNQIWAKTRSFWKGLEDKRDVYSFRCTTCGYIESYAK